MQCVDLQPFYVARFDASVSEENAEACWGVSAKKRPCDLGQRFRVLPRRVRTEFRD